MKKNFQKHVEKDGLYKKQTNKNKTKQKSEGSVRGEGEKEIYTVSALFELSLKGLSILLFASSQAPNTHRTYCLKVVLLAKNKTKQNKTKQTKKNVYFIFFPILVQAN